MWIQVATEKQKRFAKLIANGCDKDGKPITAIDAYVEAGYKELNPRNAQGVEACRLIASDTVSNLIEEERVLMRPVPVNSAVLNCLPVLAGCSVLTFQLRIKRDPLQK